MHPNSHHDPRAHPSSSSSSSAGNAPGAQQPQQPHHGLHARPALTTGLSSSAARLGSAANALPRYQAQVGSDLLGRPVGPSAVLQGAVLERAVLTTAQAQAQHQARAAALAAPAPLLPGAATAGLALVPQSAQEHRYLAKMVKNMQAISRKIALGQKASLSHS